MAGVAKAEFAVTLRGADECGAASGIGGYLHRVGQAADGGGVADDIEDAVTTEWIRASGDGSGAGKSCQEDGGNGER